MPVFPAPFPAFDAPSSLQGGTPLPGQVDTFAQKRHLPLSAHCDLPSESITRGPRSYPESNSVRAALFSQRHF